MIPETDSGGGAPPPDARAEILRLVAGRGGITLAGNREYYATLRFADGRWIRTDGDTMTGRESEGPLDDPGALACIRAVVRDRMGVHGPDRDEVGWDGVLAWLRANPFC